MSDAQRRRQLEATIHTLRVNALAFEAAGQPISAARCRQSADDFATELSRLGQRRERPL